MQTDLNRTKEKLIEILGPGRGYFGWVRMWWHGAKQYKFIGFELSDDILPIIEDLDDKQRKKLVRIMYYFEAHAHPLKRLLDADEKDGMYQFYSQTAWSNFMLVVMFGMLEYAVRDTSWEKLNHLGHLKAHDSIKDFLEENLSDAIKADVARRYSVEQGSTHGTLSSFSEVVDHLWEQIRTGFVHKAGIESKGLEWHIISGIGTREEPIAFVPDVPMPEWLQITWQAILNSFGYKGTLEHQPFEKCD